MSSKSKGFAHIALLIVIIAVSVVGFFAYQNYQLKQVGSENTEPAPTPSVTEVPTSTTTPNSPTPSLDPAADWETYTDSRYSYSLKYPRGWSIRHMDTPRHLDNPDEKLYATIIEGVGHKVSVYYEGGFDHGFSPWSPEEIVDVTIDGKLVKKVTFTLSEDSNKWIVVTSEDDILPEFFRLELSGPDQKLLNEILNTFELTD